MPKAVRQKVPESGVLRACLDLLTVERIWHERRNTVPVLVDNGRGGKRPIKVGRNGTGDIMATPQAWTDAWGVPVRVRSIAILWIECKSDSGRQTEDQKNFQAEVEAAGHSYLLVRDVEQLREWLRARRVIRG